MHASAFELLDDEHGHRAIHGRVGCRFRTFHNRTGEGSTRCIAEQSAVNIRARLPGVVEIFRVNQHNIAEVMCCPVVGHLLVIHQRHHRMVFLTETVPNQYRQEVGDIRVAGVEVLERRQDIRFAQTAITNSAREQLVTVEVSARHRKMLPLTQRTRWCEQARNRAGQMPQQTVTFTETRLQIYHGADAHVFQRAIEEHRAVEARRMMPDFRDDIGVPQHDQRRVSIGRTGETARMPGFLGSTKLQGRVTQRINDHAALENGLVVDAGNG